MKTITKVEVSFKEDFVPFLQSFNRGRDVVAIYFQECGKNLDRKADAPAVALQIYEKLHDIVDPKQWVSRTFIWNDSTDGRDFWGDVDLKWRQFLYKDIAGQSEFVGVVTFEDIQSLIPESIQGKYYTVRDLSYNRPVEEAFETCTWNRYTGSELVTIGEKYLILSDCPEYKVMGCCNMARPVIKVWIPRLNRAWWVFFNPAWVSTK